MVEQAKQTRIFISGSRSVRELSPAVQERLQNIINQGYQVLVGDSPGVDALVQRFLADRGYKNVVVYSASTPRNNIGNWPNRQYPGPSGRFYYTSKDVRMTQDATHGFAIWDGKSLGTKRNIADLWSQDKKVLVEPRLTENQVTSIRQDADTLRQQRGAKPTKASAQTTAKQPTPAQSKPITSFRDEHAYLSNFQQAIVELDGVKYPSVEHAYQAAKTNDPVWRDKIRKAPTAAEAKQLGRNKLLPLRKGWEQIKVPVMHDLLRQKFNAPKLREKLLATGNRALEEHNTWNDKVWGIYQGEGQNLLGRLLMHVRAEIRGDIPEQPFVVSTPKLDVTRGGTKERKHTGTLKQIIDSDLKSGATTPTEVLFGLQPGTTPTMWASLPRHSEPLGTKPTPVDISEYRVTRLPYADKDAMMLSATGYDTDETLEQLPKLLRRHQEKFRLKDPKDFVLSEFFREYAERRQALEQFEQFLGVPKPKRKERPQKLARPVGRLDYKDFNRLGLPVGWKETAFSIEDLPQRAFADLAPVDRITLFDAFVGDLLDDTYRAEFPRTIGWLEQHPQYGLDAPVTGAVVATPVPKKEGLGTLERVLLERAGTSDHTIRLRNAMQLGSGRFLQSAFHGVLEEAPEQLRPVVSKLYRQLFAPDAGSVELGRILARQEELRLANESLWPTVAVEKAKQERIKRSAEWQPAKHTLEKPTKATTLQKKTTGKPTTRQTVQQALPQNYDNIIADVFARQPAHLKQRKELGNLLEQSIVGELNRRALHDPALPRVLKDSPAHKAVVDYLRKQKPTGGQAGRIALGTLSRVALPVALGTEALLIHRADDRPRAIAQAIGGWTAEVPGAIAGARTGAKAGAKLGAKLGTAVLPGIGTIAGGLVGGIAGHALGRVAGGAGLDALRRKELQRRAQPVRAQTDKEIFQGLATRI